MQRGTVIAGRYRLEELLGEGGMGVVWEATREGSGERVAIKLVKESSRDLEARIRREGRVITSLRHPNVVRLLEIVDTEEGRPALVMERLVGETLRVKLERERKLPYADVPEIVRGIAKAMRAASAVGVVHRDLKPDNVFLVGGDVRDLRVLDFGVAKVVDDATVASAGLTSTGALLGTPYYMSPEQVFGEETLDSRADAWALGVIAFECLTGKRPTEAANVGQVLRMIARGELPRIASVAPETPPHIAEAITRMLATDRDKRLADWDAILATFADGAKPRRKLVRFLGVGVVATSLVAGAAGLALTRVTEPPPSFSGPIATATEEPTHASPIVVAPPVSVAAVASAPAIDAGVRPRPKTAPSGSVPLPVAPPTASIDPFHGLAVDAPF